MQLGIRAVATIYLVAVAVNYPWELAQAALFTSASHEGSVVVHCFIASLGDGLILLLLYGVGWTMRGRAEWFRRPAASEYVGVLAAGTAVAIAVEWIALHVIHRWAYADAMPLLPVLDIGVLPVLQMVLLPPLIFHAAARLYKKSQEPLRDSSAVGRGELP